MGEGKAGGNSESTIISADHDLPSTDPSAPPIPARADTSALSEESFGPPKHTDTESGLRHVWTLPNPPTSTASSSGPILAKSVTCPAVMITDNQQPPEDEQPRIASSAKGSLDLYTLPRFKSWLYLIISLKIAFYTLLSLSFNNLLPVISFPLNMYYIASSTLWFLIELIAPFRRIWILVRHDLTP